MKHDSSPHTIRLRGPCKMTWLRNGTQQAEVRVHIPCEITADLFELSTISAEDTFTLQRNFGLPTGLDDSQSVTMNVSGFEGATRAVLNRGTDMEVEQELAEGSYSFEVTKSLRANNRVIFEYRTLPAVAGQIQLVIE